MEKNEQITKITRILEYLNGESHEDALRMLKECTDYVNGRTDLFSYSIKS